MKMILKQVIYFICLSTITSSCNLNINKNIEESIDNKLENINNSGVKNKDIIISERKTLDNIFSSQIQDFKLFNIDKGLIFLEDGNILLLSKDKLEKVDELGLVDQGSMCLNSKGNGLIFSVLSSDRHFEKESTLYVSKIENYRIIEKKIISDNQIYAIRKPKCSIDENGNGLLIYPLYYIKKINNYKISDKIMDVEKIEHFIIDNENIINIIVEDYKRFKIKNINVNTKLVSKEILLENVPFGEYAVSQNSNSPLSLLIQHKKEGLELIKIKNIDNIEKIKINGIYDNYIDSFQINSDGNGIIVFSTGENKDKMSIVKVKNFTLDLKNIIEHSNLSQYSIGDEHNFSYTSIINGQGYLIWHDAKPYFYKPDTLPINYYSQIKILD